jgi:hypothetical protein
VPAPDAVRRLQAAVEFELGFPGDFSAGCEPDPFVFVTSGRRGTAVDEVDLETGRSASTSWCGHRPHQHEEAR